MKKITVCIAILLSLNGCFQGEYFYLSEQEKYLFAEGDKLIYKSNLNNFDTLVVDIYDLNTLPDRVAYPYYYEYHAVEFHFLHDQPLIKIYDSIFILNNECHYNNYLYGDSLLYQNCNDLYNLDSYYMNIKFNVGTRTGNNTLKWKKHPVFSLNEYSNENNLIINGIDYNSVYILERDEEFTDSSILFKKVFFNYNYGILRYENNNSEIFELVGKL